MCFAQAFGVRTGSRVAFSWHYQGIEKLERTRF
jgi:hypothetical protein